MGSLMASVQALGAVAHFSTFAGGRLRAALCRSSLERLDDVDVVEDLRLAGQLDTCLLEPWPELVAKGSELFRGLPHLAYVDVVVGAEGDVKLAAVRRPVPPSVSSRRTVSYCRLDTFEGGKRTRMLMLTCLQVAPS